ncbi:2-keto-4-pentenoate hydratase [Hyaloraphidium curvatum]|nr:2-keto-4-pentenoate hydratase [Hyaloraphidium curvatum]
MFDPDAAARWIASQRSQRLPYANLPEELAPPDVSAAYAAQEALHDLLTPELGPIGALKIATTTPVMQKLMGIGHPTAGAVFASQMRRTPATLASGDFVRLVLECELAVKLGADLGDRGTPWTAKNVQFAVAGVAPAFEVVEDRCAVYSETKAFSLIADNAWNAGMVLGEEVACTPGMELHGIPGRLDYNGSVTEGKTDGPLAALAWLANLAVDRGRPLRAGMLVITGSVVPPVYPKAGDELAFELDGIGRVEVRVT